MKDPNHNQLKKIFYACILTVAVSTAGATSKNLVNGVFEEGYFDPLVHAVGAVAHTRIALPLAKMILLHHKASSSVN